MSAALPITLTGIIDGLPNETYRAAPGLSKSDLDRVAGLAPPRDTTALEFGAFFHCLVLEPDALLDRYYRAPHGVRKDKRVTAWQEVLDIAATRVVIDPNDWETGLRMRDAVYDHYSASELLREGVTERSAFGLDPASGLLLKCRPDCTREDIRTLVDIKSAQTASPAQFGTACAEYRYHCQAYHYLHVYNLAVGHQAVRDFVWVVAEKSYPYHVFVVEMPQEDLDLGRLEIRADIDLYQRRHLINLCRLPEWYRRRKAYLLEN